MNNMNFLCSVINIDEIKKEHRGLTILKATGELE